MLIAVGACGRNEAFNESFSIAGREYSEAALTQFLLPKPLREISGLAFDPQNRLFAHDDERGSVYRIDHVAGRIVDHFELEGRVRDDFEGIAATGQRIYLVTSNGTIYESGLGGDGEETPYTRHAAKLPCEVEGLVYEDSTDRLIVACKRLFDAPSSIALQLYVWSVERKGYLSEATISVHQKSLADQGLPPGGIEATGIELTPSGNYLILAGKAHLLLEISPFGILLSVARLPERRHPQAEGIALGQGGEILIADEAGSGGTEQKPGGRLSVYQPTE